MWRGPWLDGEGVVVREVELMIMQKYAVGLLATDAFSLIRILRSSPQPFVGLQTGMAHLQTQYYNINVCISKAIADYQHE